MAKQHTARASEVESLAREIYIRMVTSPTAVAKTRNNLAETALSDAESFQNVISKWRGEVSPTAPEGALPKG